MDYNSAAWLQAQQIPDLQTVSVHDERSAAGSNDWKETAASVQGGSMNDLLGDIQGHHSPTPPLSTSNGYPHLAHMFLSTTPAYAPVSYANQWITTPQVPLSSYSSLNGATSTSSHSQQHPQGQGQGQGMSQSQGSSPMVIDPALTTMNGSSSSPPQQYQQPAYLSHQAHSRLQYQYPMTSMNSPFIHSSPSQYQPHTQQQQQHPNQLVRHSHSPPQPQQQGTLSPFVLHSPNSGYYGGISPSSFYGQMSQPVAGPSSAASPSSQATSQTAPTPPPTAPAHKSSPEQLRTSLVADVRPLIQANSFTGGGAVTQLANILSDFGIAAVDAQVRLDILTKIRDNAGNHYFRAWVDNSIAMEIAREWLKLAFVGRDDQQMVETIMPLLQIIDRLPLTLEKLKESKLGKLIIKLIKEPPTPAIKDMAANLEIKWRKMLSRQVPDKAESEDAEDAKGKKRRADSVSSKSAPPVKKAAIPVAGSSMPKAVPVKKEAKPVVKDAKSDSSFFSKPKPTKKELPSFKKGPSTAPTASSPTAPVKKAPELNIAQPSSVDGFQEILKSWVPSAGSSTPPTAPGPSTGPATGPSGPAGPSLGKRKKSVTWAPDGQLEQIKLIDRAVYDDDGATGSHPTHTLRDLDRDEGAALHNHLFEEQMEWTEPQPLEMPPEIEMPPRGGDSQERAAQEEREQTALVASYASAAQIPDSPAEPPAQLPEEQVDEGVQIMLTGSEVDAIFWSDGAPALVDAIHPSTSVADLVGQLAAMPAPDVMMGDPSQPPNMPSFSPEQLQQLTQALSQNGLLGGLGGAPPPSISAPPGVDQPWGNQYTDFDRGYHEPNGVGRGAAEPNRRWGEDGWGDRSGPRGRGRGGPPMRGRGRGDGFRITKRKPCSFFHAGRCRYGDQCDFSHEPLNYN